MLAEAGSLARLIIEGIAACSMSGANKNIPPIEHSPFQPSKCSISRAEADSGTIVLFFVRPICDIALKK